MSPASMEPRGWTDERSLQTAEEGIRRSLATQTPSLMPLARRLALAALHDVTVLLTGETGTGKTYLAQLLHDWSPRRGHRLLVVPCGALAPSLMESEMFGHVKGAFTGADRPKEGKLAAAGQGSLLLDEIDALPMPQQARLLRVIETGEYEPVGGNETRACAARVIAASSGNLQEAVAQGHFREDLYYRLDVMAFHLPPLRHRLSDIAPLARHLVERFARRYGKELDRIHPAALGRLETYPWPGNIRQLENVLQQAVLVANGAELREEHMPLLRHTTGAEAPAPGRGVSLRHQREQHDYRQLKEVLAQCDNNRTRAAKVLGISRVALYKKLHRYNPAGRRD